MKKMIFTVLVLAVLFSCKPEQQTEKDGFLIVTTTGMLADMAKSITGEYAEVVSLMGPGVDPHLYKATQGDLSLLKKADVVIYNGLHLEGKMGEVLEKLAQFPNKQVIAAAENIAEENRILSDEKMKVYDPHVWFDVELWSQTADPILLAIQKMDAEHAETYIAHAEVKKNELRVLHKWVSDQIATIPAENRVLITAHDAFEYFGRAYGIEVKGLQGISTLSEAGIKDVTDLVDEIVQQNIKAVFVESSVPRKSLEAVVEGVKSHGYEIEIGGTLFSDAMGENGTVEGTYKGMVEHNVKTIVEALK